MFSLKSLNQLGGGWSVSLTVTYLITTTNYDTLVEVKNASNLSYASNTSAQTTELCRVELVEQQISAVQFHFDSLTGAAEVLY